MRPIAPVEDSGALLRLHQVTIRANKADTSSAISLEDAGTMLLDGCTITGNRSRAGGNTGDDASCGF